MDLNNEKNLLSEALGVINTLKCYNNYFREEGHFTNKNTDFLYRNCILTEEVLDELCGDIVRDYVKKERDKSINRYRDIIEVIDKGYMSDDIPDGSDNSE